MNLSTPALIGLGLLGGLTVFAFTSGGGTRRRPPVPVPSGADGPEPDPYTPPPTSSGDADVVYLQQVVNAIFAKYPAVGISESTPLVEDGLIGSLTEGAVDEILIRVWDVVSGPWRADLFENIPGVNLGSLAVWSHAEGEGITITDARRLGEWLNTYVLTATSSLLGG